VLAALVLEDGRPWGTAADRVQWADASGFLADDAPPYAFWTRARGYSKTVDAVGLTLAQMVTAPTGWRGYWLAADVDQAALGVDAGPKERVAEGFDWEAIADPRIRGPFGTVAPR
jgi:hypothetical protein